MKNKNLLSIIAFVGFLFIFASCSDFDTLPEGDNLTSSQKDEVYELNPDRVEAGVNAIFAQFNQFTPNEDALGAERHNDFGYPSIMMFTDANGEDVVSEDNGYNWTGFNLDFSDRSFTSNESQIVWNDFYKIIYTSNNVIASIDEESDDATDQFYLAQGLAVRAFSYFGLAQLYQFNYVGNESKPCVPVVTEENMEDAPVDGTPRATVKDVYELILSDLDSAIELLEEVEETNKILKAAKEPEIKRRDKRYVSLAVAYGLRARVHLTMQKWSEASSDADDAITAATTEKITVAGLKDVNKPAFMEASEKNWMWGIIIAETDRIVTSGIVSWMSHMGSFNYGYANFSGGRQINKKLFESIGRSDVRRGWWIDEDKVSPNLTEDQQATINGYGYSAYTQVKFAPYNNVLKTSTNANDMPLMRIEEMHLIKAEAAAMSSSDASVLVDFIKEYRDPLYKFNKTSREDIQEEVFRHRRIELWGEGVNWYDIMRLNKGVDRRGGGYPNKTMIFNIPAGSDILLWRIPEAEIQANPLISEGDNNPAAPAPSPVSE